MSLIASAKGRWFQWSLRSSLLILLLLGVAFAWWGAKVRRESRIKNAVRLIATSPDILGDGYDPIAIVRVVNALQALGKDEAIEALRRFAAQYPGHGGQAFAKPIKAIIWLLFDRADPEDQFL